MLYKEQEIATQDAPPRASVLRMSKGRQLYEDRARFMEHVEACLPAAPKPSTPTAVKGRRPTPRMHAYWDAIQEARNRVLSLRAIARELGISRSTVTRYVKASRPAVYGEGSLEEENALRLTESLVSSP